MNILRDFYIKSMSAVAIALALAAIAYTTLIEPALKAKYLAGSWQLTLASVVTNRAFLVVLLATLEYLVRKKLWKLLLPELDFSGTWKGFTTYAHVRVGSATVPDKRDQKVVIEQDCLNLRLLPSRGKDFVFDSKTIDILDGGLTLAYAYYVRYGAGTPERPPEAYGYEELKVIRKEDERRPRQLRGWFSHCAIGHTPVFAGDVELTRVGK